ncbi:hypothetical protein M1316_01810 [Candidatus Parvarchaeota archaeon]|nr:hypothetical protein [Candidatus Parvarchaeota archaeon]
MNETEFIPKWLLSRLKMLWNRFGEKEFGFDDAVKALDDDPRIVAQILSNLNRKNWLLRQRDPKDARRVIYKISDPKMVETITKLKI